MRRRILFLLGLAAFVISTGVSLLAQAPSNDRVQVSPPIRRAEPPSAGATAEELEARGDQLRAEKAYLDALDYYRAALKKNSGRGSISNKAGITELLLQRYDEAKKSFEQAIRRSPRNPDAYNNLGVIFYLRKKYGKAINQYEKAIQVQDDTASYYSNMGAAYFSKKEFEKASLAYGRALQLDPDTFERTSRSGVSAQMSSPEDRAHFDYVMAKLFAQAGNADRSLLYLRKAMEDGYKKIEDVYKDDEFAGLRKDPRFTELMNTKPPAIPD